MKKFIIIISISIYMFSFFQLESFGNNNTQLVEISKIENELYGFDYINDEIKNRVVRLEKSVYGKESYGDLNSRIKKLGKDIISEQIGLEIEPSVDTFEYKDNTIADNSVNYPIVDEIEMKLFKKKYPERDFHTRIVTIERELFGKIYDVEDYSTRMDRIKAEVVPERLAREKVFGYDNTDETIDSTELSGLNQSKFGTYMPYGQENYTRPYTNYGDYTGGASPINQHDELAQMEYDTFGTEFSNDDTTTRLKRLNSVNKAKKSANKYDSARFQQRMSTAMEIGAMLLMILAMVL